ncbi:hTAFII28-like protein conserved region-domain-containing protein [Parachaetomium inaequale]|uniref:HTAFII28-like protein conserved region-domain-containing protein n=1 Tax=Parachaetomium inaequale TaxID=2588326 RepID=A0AAN6PH24_9PEZI|nr:hTAFII28-like protein conserved region-domain-containing protein [Parachaetomium inaequale]
MASPSHSPPYSQTPLPGINTMSSNKKRTADGPAAPALKRRKASTISTASGAASAHPLRQTSFPPDDSSALFGARSPSVDVDTMSLVSGSQVSAAAPVKKKRGRKSKAEKAREQTPSVAGGRAPTAASGVSDGGGGRGNKSVAGGGGGGDEGEGDDEGPTEVAATADVRTKEQKEEEHRMRGMLISALSDDQFYRFENWRAANLSKASVRRLVNATISQSVAENVVIGMRAVAKVFIGDIIESARRVQGEWIERLDEKQTDLPTPPATVAPTPTADGEADTQTRNSEVDDRRGPLRPEHLREAVRRYRKGFEGGGVGMQWVYHQQQQGGVERFPTRTGGRRIFR